MTERIRNLRKFFIEEHQHRTFRKAPGDPYLLAAAFREQNLPDTERAVKRLVYMLDEETPLLFPEQTILFLRTNPTLQALFTEEEKEALAAAYRLHELGELSNICVDYTRFLNAGFPGMRSRLEAHKNKFVSCGQMEKRLIWKDSSPF